jgi:Flp pilus assembly protein TadG
MRRLRGLYRRFVKAKRGVAAIEFAIILPALVVIFLATFDAGRAVAIYMKVRAATYALGAITNQYTTIHDSDMQQILGATAVVLTPYPSAPVVVVVSELQITASGTVKVSWSDTLNGAVRTSPPTVPSGYKKNSTYVIFAEVSYTYTPMFGYFSSGAITLSDNLYITPRSSAKIARVSP